MLPGITNIAQDSSERDYLRLIGEVKDTVHVQHVKELGRPLKTSLRQILVFQVGTKRKVEEGLPIPRNLRKFFTHFSTGFGISAFLPGVKQRNNVKKIRIGDVGQDARVGVRGSKCTG